MDKTYELVHQKQREYHENKLKAIEEEQRKSLEKQKKEYETTKAVVVSGE